jgi:uncharacterized membrane protein
MTTELLSAAAVLASALFAGAAVYINLVEHPARMACGTAIAATQFAPSYRRATVMQVSLALLATIAAVASWLHTGQRGWLAGAALIVAVIPYTLLFIMPTNRLLLASDPRGDVQRLLKRWGRLHAVRSVLSLAAVAMFLVVVVGR